MDRDGEMVMGSLGWKQVTGWEESILGKKIKPVFVLTNVTSPFLGFNKYPGCGFIFLGWK